MKNYIAQFSTELGDVSLDRLVDEVRINTATDPMMVEQIDESTWFTVECSLDESEIEPEHYFDTLARDLSSWLGVEVILHDVKE